MSSNGDGNGWGILIILGVVVIIALQILAALVYAVVGLVILVGWLVFLALPLVASGGLLFVQLKRVFIPPLSIPTAVAESPRLALPSPESEPQLSGTVPDPHPMVVSPSSSAGGTSAPTARPHAISGQRVYMHCIFVAAPLYGLSLVGWWMSGGGPEFSEWFFQALDQSAHVASTSEALGTYGVFFLVPPILAFIMGWILIQVQHNRIAQDVMSLLRQLETEPISLGQPVPGAPLPVNRLFGDRSSPLAGVFSEIQRRLNSPAMLAQALESKTEIPPQLCEQLEACRRQVDGLQSITLPSTLPLSARFNTLLQERRQQMIEDLDKQIERILELEQLKLQQQRSAKEYEDAAQQLREREAALQQAREEQKLLRRQEKADEKRAQVLDIERQLRLDEFPLGLHLEKVLARLRSIAKADLQQPEVHALLVEVWETIREQFLEHDLIPPEKLVPVLEDLREIEAFALFMESFSERIRAVQESNLDPQEKEEQIRAFNRMRQRAIAEIEQNGFS